MQHDIWKSCGRIRTKLGGQVGCVTRKNCFDFGEDLNPDPDQRIFKVLLHHWVIGIKRYRAWHFKKLWLDSDETWWAGCVCNIEELIRFWWRSGSDNFFKTDPSPLNDRAKLICSTIFQRIRDGFGWNFVDELVRWEEQAHYIFVQVRIQIQPIRGIQNVK